MDKLKMHSPDLTGENIAKLAELFPQCVVECRGKNGELTRKIDFEALQQELSGVIVDGSQERYMLNWPGKREAILEANTPVKKTLRPSCIDSVDFNKTKNIYIEGENLDALKLIRNTYLGKVKLIYIDPPYNTGSDLVYHDKFSQSGKTFQEDSTAPYKADNFSESYGSGTLEANPETKGRYHSVWLSMIYPRLKLAHQLLADDGVILISIDDYEIFNLRRICDEIFGRENFIAQIVWEKGRKNDARLFSVGHEYILVITKNKESLKQKGIIWREEKPGAKEIWEEYLHLKSKFGNDIATIELHLKEWFNKLPKKHPAKKLKRYAHVDVHGPWRDDNISWPGGDGPCYDVIHPITKKPCKVPERGWVFAQPETMEKMIDLGIVVFRDDHTEPPIRKNHIHPIDEEVYDFSDGENATESDDETDGLATQVRGSYFYAQSQVSVKYLRNMFDGIKLFDNPKDCFELKKLFSYLTADTPDALIIDFFSGSASTAEAVFEANRADGGTRHFILVQIPEVCNPKNKTGMAALRAGYKNICEIGKERIRRAGAKIKAEWEAAQKQSENDLFSEAEEKPTLDIGFRVLKLDSSNMEDTYYTPDDTMQNTLDGLIDNVKPDRKPLDLLFQIMLDWGVELSAPIAEEKLSGKTVYFVDTDAIAACFDTGITDELVRTIAERRVLRAVFRDNGFATDAAKINVKEIFKQLSPVTEMKVI